MVFTILGYAFAALVLYALGCIRGEHMEKERAENMLNTGKPFYTTKDGTNIYVQTAMHTTREVNGSFLTLKEQPKSYMGEPPLTIGKKYLIKEIDGSSFIIDDDMGNTCSISKYRFYLD